MKYILRYWLARLYSTTGVFYEDRRYRLAHPSEVDEAKIPSGKIPIVLFYKEQSPVIHVSLDELQLPGFR